MPYFGIPIRNGLPIGLGSVAGFGIAPFSPESLFENGEVGAWYDPSDYSTLFTDSAGTTPVTGVEQFVGLMLDKSKGLVLGSELVTNGDFSSGTTGWTAEGTNTIAVVGGELEVTLNSALFNGAAGTSFATVVGTTYRVTATCRRGTTGSNVIVRLGSTDITFTTTSNVTVTRYITATGTSITPRVITQASGGSGTFYVDNISVRELPGNHAFQTSSAKRPKLAARYNLLTYSEEFDNVYWSNYQIRAWGSGSVANATVAPDGTTTADLAVESNTNDSHVPFFRLSQPTPGAYVFSISGKTYSGSLATRYLALRLYVGVNDFIYVTFDLNLGTYDIKIGSASTFSNVTASIFPQNNGFYRCVVRFTNATAVNVLGAQFSDVPAPTLAQLGSIGSVSYAGDNTSGIYIWGADLRPASQATGAIGPTYQRVAAATVYDTAGFLPYLAFDGLDDSMSTNSIDFSAGDKVTVWAGVRKISVPSTQIICELSADTNTNNGSFLLSCSNAANRDYSFTPKGTVAPTTPAFFAPAAAPDTAVITAQAEISTDFGELRRNGVNGTASSGDLGAGNFLTNPLYIGARNNASLFFNGWLTSLIVRGAQSTQSQIEATEAWVNSRTGAY